MSINRISTTWQPPPAPWFSFGGVSATEEEIKISKPFTVRVVEDTPIQMSAAAIKTKLPDRPGIYFIYRRDLKTGALSLHYVGKSEASIRRRFQDRLKAFADFGLNAADYDHLLARSQVTCITVHPAGTLPKEGVSRGPERGPYRHKNTLPGLISAVEQYYISKFKPMNQRSEKVIFASPGSLRIILQYKNGAAPAMDYFDATRPISAI